MMIENFNKGKKDKKYRRDKTIRQKIKRKR